MSRLKNLKNICEIIHKGMPLTWVRKANEIDLRLILELFTHDHKITWVINDVFSEVNSLTQLSYEKVISLLSILETEAEWIESRNIDQVQQVVNQENESKQEEEKSFDDQLTNVMRFIQKIAHDVEEGGMDTMKGYIALKKIAKALKVSEDLTKNLAYDVFG